MTKSNRIVDVDKHTDAYKMQTLRDQRNNLKIALTTYGQHLRACPAIAGRLCECGWVATAKAHGVKL